MSNNKTILIAFALLLMASAASAQVPIINPHGGGGGGGSSVFGSLQAALSFNYAGPLQPLQILAVTAPFNMTLPANLAMPTTQISCGTNPIELDTYSLKCNGTLVGTVSIDTTCHPSYTTLNGVSQLCPLAGRLELDAPNTISGSDIAITVVVTIGG